MKHEDPVRSPPAPAGMYCGSCLRDNALAAELLARGHDVTLLPLYTPTRDRRAERQPRAGLLRRHQRLPAAALGAFPEHAGLLDRLWDSRLGAARWRRAAISVDPQVLGELTVSMLRGEEGFQRKEIDKLVDWLASRAALRRGQSPVLAAHRAWPSRSSGR